MPILPQSGLKGSYQIQICAVWFLDSGWYPIDAKATINCILRAIYQSYFQDVLRTSKLQDIDNQLSKSIIEDIRYVIAGGEGSKGRLRSPIFEANNAAFQN